MQSIISTKSEIQFEAYAFVKNLLLGQEYILDWVRCFPLGNMEMRDEFAVVDYTLLNFANIDFANIIIDKNPWELVDVMQSTPVAVINLADIKAKDLNKALDICTKKIYLLVLCLSFGRMACGEIFNITLINKSIWQIHIMPKERLYTGNLWTWYLTGENSELIQNQLKALETSPMKTFRLRLYNEALGEQNDEFKYMRYWQILETIADSKNYDANQPLIDFNGNVILNADKTGRSLSNPVDKVYELLRSLKQKNNVWEHVIHDKIEPIDLRDMVNYRLAFRNSVAHFWSITKRTELRDKRVKKYAKDAIDKIRANNRLDFILWDLGSIVNRVLGLELNNT